MVRDGILPEGWVTVQLRDICAITSGHGFKFEEYSNGGVKLLRINNVTFGQIIWDQIVFLPENYIQDYPKLVLNEGDILIALNRPIIGNQLKIGIMKTVDSPAILYQRVGRIDIRDHNKVCPIFLFHLLRTPFFIKKLTERLSGSDQPYINPTEMVKIAIPLPPLSTQRQIVAILEQAEATKRLRVESDELTQRFLQSVFMEMFGDPVKNEKGWVIKKLGDICSDIKNGLYVPKEKYLPKSGTEMVHMSDAFYGEVITGDLKRVDISQEEIEKYGLSDNDILIARRSLVFSGAAKACMVPPLKEPLVFESSIIKITPFIEQILPIYLYNYFNNEVVRGTYITKYISKSTISGINQENLRSIQILVPPLALQQEFAQIVEQVETLRERQRQSAGEISLLFEGLMQKAFTGDLVA